MVISEADLSIELSKWYIRVTNQFGWFTAEWYRCIASNPNEEIVPDFEVDMSNNIEEAKDFAHDSNHNTIYFDI